MPCCFVHQLPPLTPVESVDSPVANSSRPNAPVPLGHWSSIVGISANNFHARHSPTSSHSCRVLSLSRGAQEQASRNRPLKKCISGVHTSCLVQKELLRSSADAVVWLRSCETLPPQPDGQLFTLRDLLRASRCQSWFQVNLNLRLRLGWSTVSPSSDSVSDPSSESSAILTTGSLPMRPSVAPQT